MRFVRLLPLVALFVFGAFIAGQAQPVLATLNTFTVSTPTAGVGQQVVATGSLLNIPTASTITMTATNGFFTSGSASVAGGVTGFGTPTLTFVNTNPIGVATLTGVWVCQTPGTTTFTLTQTPAAVTAPSTLTTTLACSTLATTPPTQATSLTATVNGTCIVAGQILTATGKGAFSTFPVLNMDVVSPTTASCIAPGPFTLGYACSLDGLVTFNMPVTPATLTCSGGANPYTPANQICPMYNAVAPYGGGVAYPGTAPYTGSPFPYGYNGALNQTTGLPYAYNFNPTQPSNPASPFNGFTYPANYASVVPYTGLTYPTGYNPVGPNPPPLNQYPYAGPLGGFPNGVTGAFPNGAPVGTGSNYCPPNPATDVAAKASASSVSCGGNAIVEALVRDGAGLPVTNGQKVTFSSSIGTMNPVSVATNPNGRVESKFMAPATGSGTATITIVAESLANGDVSAAPLTINVDCPPGAIATPMPAFSAPYAPVMLPPNTGEGRGSIPMLRPPNTGDAGLAEAVLRND